MNWSSPISDYLARTQLQENMEPCKQRMGLYVCEDCDGEGWTTYEDEGEDPVPCKWCGMKGFLSFGSCIKSLEVA